VRDVDGKTFWDALDEAVSPRVKAPTPVDDSALSTFRNIFQGRSLKKGTLILLTWLEPSKMLVSLQRQFSFLLLVCATYRLQFPSSCPLTLLPHPKKGEKYDERGNPMWILPWRDMKSSISMQR